MKVADAMREFDMFLLDLPDSFKEAIGWGIQFTQWGGTALSFFSQLGLAMQGIEKMGGIGGTIKTFGGMIKAPFSAIGGVLGGMGTKGAATSGMFGALGTGNSKMEKAFQSFGKKFVGLFKKLGNSLTEGGELGAANLIDRIWDGIQYLTSFLWGGIKFVGGLVTGLINSVDWSSIVAKITGAITGFFTWVKDTVVGWQVLDKVTSAVKLVGTKLADFFTWVWTTISGWNLIDKVLTAITLVGTKLLDFFTWIWTKIAGWSIWDKVLTAVALVGTKLIEFFTWVWAKISGWSILDKVLTAVALVGTKLVEFFGWIAAKITASSAGSAISTALAGIASAISSLFSWIAARIAASSVGQAVGGAISGAGAAIGGGGAGAAAAGLAVPVAIGAAGAAAIKELLERSGIESWMGGGWYWMPKKNEFMYMTSAQEKFQGDPHFKIGEPATSLESIVQKIAHIGGFQEIAEKYGWDYYAQRMKYLGFAKGGIVTEPTMGLVGEAEPEAIIPLDKLAGLGGDTYNITINNPVLNTQHDIRKLAQRLIAEFEILKRSSNLS